MAKARSPHYPEPPATRYTFAHVAAARPNFWVLRYILHAHPRAGREARDEGGSVPARLRHEAVRPSEGFPYLVCVQLRSARVRVEQECASQTNP